MRLLSRLLEVCALSLEKYLFQYDFIKGWFVIESELNQKYLTVKDGVASSGQQVVNTSPQINNKGQLWMWKEGYLVSKLDRSLVLDGTFGKVSIKKKKHGNIYQKWRFDFTCFNDNM